MGWWNKRKSEYNSNRKRLIDIKPNEIVTVESSIFLGRIGKLTCINNDPYTQKIVLQIAWTNHSVFKTEILILDYDDDMFDNFHLLNSVNVPAPIKKGDEHMDSENPDDYDIAKLQAMINKKLDSNDHTGIDELQKKIDKLTKK